MTSLTTVLNVMTFKGWCLCLSCACQKRRCTSKSIPHKMLRLNKYTGTILFVLPVLISNLVNSSSSGQENDALSLSRSAFMCLFIYYLSIYQHLQIHTTLYQTSMHLSASVRSISFSSSLSFSVRLSVCLCTHINNPVIYLLLHTTLTCHLWPG